MTITVEQSFSLTGMNYGQLKTMIATRLGRTNLGAVIPDFIALAEARLYTGSSDYDMSIKPLRINAMLGTETQSLSSLPAGFLAIKRITVPTCPHALQFVTPEVFADICPSTFARYYTFQDGGVVIEGGTPTVFSMSYYRRFAALVSDTDTNWLLQNCPSAYLYGALIEAYNHIKDEARTTLAARMYGSAVNGLMMADDDMRFSGSTLSIGSAR